MIVKTKDGKEFSSEGEKERLMAKDWIAYWMARGETAERAAYLLLAASAAVRSAGNEPALGRGLAIRCDRFLALGAQRVGVARHADAHTAGPWLVAVRANR